MLGFGTGAAGMLVYLAYRLGPRLDVREVHSTLIRPDGSEHRRTYLMRGSDIFEKVVR
jgi:hypothetical protein